MHTVALEDLEGWKLIGYCNEPVQIKGHAEMAKEAAATFRHVNCGMRTGGAAVFISLDPPSEPRDVALHPARLARLCWKGHA